MKGPVAISSLLKWMNRYFQRAVQMHSAQCSILVLRLECKQMCTCSSCVSWQLHGSVCLSPYPNFTVVSSIKNKVLAHSLATLPFL